MSKEAYFGRASGLDRSHRAIPDHSYAKTFTGGLNTAAEKTQSGPLPQVALYEHLHFEGGTAVTAFDWEYLGDWWTNKVASIVVLSGTWEFYTDRNFTGDRSILGAGYYDDVAGSIGSMRARR